MHKKGCHRSTHQRKRREMKLVLLLLLPARGGLKAKCTEGSREGERESERLGQSGKEGEQRAEIRGAGRTEQCASQTTKLLIE